MIVYKWRTRSVSIGVDNTDGSILLKLCQLWWSVGLNFVDLDKTTRTGERVSENGVAGDAHATSGEFDMFTNLALAETGIGKQQK